MMISLKQPGYISADGSFGSSQMWFDKSGPPLARTLRADGCGAVAAADTLAYLQASGALEERARAQRFDCDRATAMARVVAAHRQIVHIYPAVGATGLSLAGGLRRYFKAARIPLTARWYCPADSEKFLDAAQIMLARDIPVILSLPPRLVFYSPLRLYASVPDAAAQSRPQQYKSRFGHYVVVTAIHDGGVPILELSSWGKRYSMRFDEYAALRRTPLSCIAGGVVYIAPAAAAKA
ncbi:MAG: hypothetical protein VB092_05925 [Oscillospiraceae bacterium]|nr:hypothetical protein [Oscillospiraceae bacterium]